MGGGGGGGYRLGCVRSVSPRHLHEKQLVVERRAVSQSACTFSFFLFFSQPFSLAKSLSISFIALVHALRIDVRAGATPTRLQQTGRCY